MATPLTESTPYKLRKNGETISPWHDIPLFVDSEKEIVNMVVEIPRATNPKMELSKDEQHNPIGQDVSKGKPRMISDVAPFKGYPCNYGALPQTWECPDIEDSKTGIPGDDDPLDVCEIGDGVAYCGEVKRVKPLGAFAVLDEGETDWKVLVIDVKDPLASKISDIQDVEASLPGYLDSLKTWYRVYKVSDGKLENDIALEGKVEDKRFAFDLIRRCHVEWEKSRKGYPG
ncbi:inorganic pyrophosphatase [Aspergillus novoparasiticus]|uniref:inorganic diphosphatase n=1 Tax=Aspergillus novoparasiticus TaxID=986946 RepID=A0A5N6EXZ9_9EURO|nr:inorganic pyrophosphatase [Aspergillus novoparasiticus]